MNYRDPNAAFASAIAQGLDPDMFMYMYSTEERDYFKHVETREYVRSAASLNKAETQGASLRHRRVVTAV